MKNQSNLFSFDEKYHKEYASFAGIDEAGRGPLAGPVTAAAVILPKDFYNSDINDSKKLSPQKRQELSFIIKKEALSFSIISIDNTIIDKINILQASLLAMKEAALSLKIKPQICIIDGNKQIPNLEIAQKTIVKGDAKSASIAAASILAKVERDKIMIEFSKRFPKYNFAKHKGYPTKEHIEEIKKYGVSVIHRKSFSPIFQILNQMQFEF
ncbi:MAG: ribonuclease HII [Elusimicrobiota bacterium]|nr:ribonuclease HII [Elusimicrobiota bacterium]